MSRLPLLFIACLFSLLILAANTAAASKDEALEAATVWLALVDKGEYERSWQQASTLFKRAVTPEQWQKAVQDARELLGAVEQRSLANTEEHSSLPGVPDGRYMILFFDSQFESKEEAEETVTVMMDTDGSWRIAGYYVR